ncbi:hypothetical protein DMB92_01550 [Campylobacter sp. MIT 99-7217]|uniref:OmpA family protein n=1 Tax=Campylobacter sp. MIT 99-7217 TaxID=535091 RepID=UPI00115915E9|nr:OmpA family protein [Campylobacter sp. MIT 99-7217]TQR34671.1 hypothetical protein DMB92_01550 [Campylobacter sp. MIT 99-7217]
MKYKNNPEKNDNFYIVYADLMAGLLFVFLLIIGAVVIKYTFAQDDLKQSKESLARQSKSLEESKQELRDKEKILYELGLRLSATSNELLSMNEQKKMLEANVSSYQELSKNLSQNLDDRDKQMLILLAQLSAKEEEVDILNQKYENIRIKIENLESLRSRMIEQLKLNLEANVSIDSRTGAISLPSEVLFDRGSFVLKEEAKENLRQILNQYLSAILNNNEILSNIENITIEGHTDSDGSYMYNLDLSQKRAYEVMSFIYSFYKDPKLQKYLLASGRSFSDPILIGGKENKERSRRIEIKFNISNEATIKEALQLFNENK